MTKTKPKQTTASPTSPAAAVLTADVVDVAALRSMLADLDRQREQVQGQLAAAELDVEVRERWAPQFRASVRAAAIERPERMAALLLLLLRGDLLDVGLEGPAIEAAVQCDLPGLARGVAVPVLDDGHMMPLLERLAAGWGVQTPAKPTLPSVSRVEPSPARVDLIERAASTGEAPAGEPDTLLDEVAADDATPTLSRLFQHATLDGKLFGPVLLVDVLAAYGDQVLIDQVRLAVVDAKGTDTLGGLWDAIYDGDPLLKVYPELLPVAASGLVAAVRVHMDDMPSPAPVAVVLETAPTLPTEPPPAAAPLANCDHVNVAAVPGSPPRPAPKPDGVMYTLAELGLDGAKIECYPSAPYHPSAAKRVRGRKGTPAEPEPLPTMPEVVLVRSWPFYCPTQGWWSYGEAGFGGHSATLLPLYTPQDWGDRPTDGRGAGKRCRTPDGTEFVVGPWSEAIDVLMSGQQRAAVVPESTTAEATGPLLASSMTSGESVAELRVDGGETPAVSDWDFISTFPKPRPDMVDVETFDVAAHHHDLIHRMVEMERQYASLRSVSGGTPPKSKARRQMTADLAQLERNAADLQRDYTERFGSEAYGLLRTHIGSLRPPARLADEPASPAIAGRRAQTTADLPPARRSLMGDPAVNDNGMYERPERVRVPLPAATKCSAEVLLACGNDGVWRASRDVSTRTGAAGGLPSVIGDDHEYSTREWAIHHVCRDIAGWFDAEGQAKAAAATREFSDMHRPANVPPDAPGMPRREKRYAFDADVADVLRRSTAAGSTLTLPAGQLDRKLYERVNKAVELMGGKWNKKQKCHLFAGANVAKVLAAALDDGSVLDRKQTFQFFETPGALAAKLVELADIAADMTVLEPSAGTGSIARAVVREQPKAKLYLVELDAEHRQSLYKLQKEHGAKVWTTIDFLGWKGDPSFGVDQFDRVVMNPPFSGGQDADHVVHAWDLLKPGGRLVAIVSGNLAEKTDRRSQRFRDLLDQGAAKLIPLPAGTFAASGTDVATQIVVLDKAGEPAPGRGKPRRPTPLPVLAAAESAVEVAAEQPVAAEAANPFADARNRDAYEAVPLATVFDAAGLPGRLGLNYGRLMSDVRTSGVTTLGLLEDELNDGATLDEVFSWVPAEAVDLAAAAVAAWFRRRPAEPVVGAGLTTRELEASASSGRWLRPDGSVPIDVQRTHGSRVGHPLTVAGRDRPHVVTLTRMYSDVAVYVLHPLEPQHAAAVSWGRRRSEKAYANVAPEEVPLAGVECVGPGGRPYVFGDDDDALEVTRPRSEVRDHHAKLHGEADVAAFRRAHATRIPATPAKRKGGAAA